MTADRLCPISINLALSELYTLHHVYFLARAFNSRLQVRNVFLLKLLKLSNKEQSVFFSVFLLLLDHRCVTFTLTVDFYFL